MTLGKNKECITIRVSTILLALASSDDENT